MDTRVDLFTYSDADFAKSFQVGHQDTGFVPYDLTGAQLLMMVRRTADDVEVLINLSSASAGIDISDAVNGTFTILITRDRLSRLTPGDYVQSLIVVPPSGLHEDFWHGVLTHTIGPTR